MSTKMLVCSLFVLLVSAVYAQEMMNPFSIGPQVGYFKASDADDGNIMPGAALRLRLANALGLEASIDYRQEHYHNDAITLKSWPVLITGLFYPTQYIYGAVGVGWYNTQIEYSKELDLFSDKSSQKFGWHFGAGVEMPLTKQIKLATDFRYTFLNYDFGAVPGTNNISSDFFIITAGLFFQLN
jgi:opacity protein-like surface antigen